MGAYLTGFHRSTKSNPQIQFRGLKTDFGALVMGHAFAWFHQNRPLIAFVWFPPKPANPVLQGPLNLGHWVLSKNPQATEDHHSQARQGYDSTTFSPRFSHVPKAYSGLDSFFAAILIFLMSTKKQFWGFKTGFGALVKGHPLAWVHVSLSSTVRPGAYLTEFHRSTKTPPQIQFRGSKTGFGALLKGPLA